MTRNRGWSLLTPSSPAAGWRIEVKGRGRTRTLDVNFPTKGLAEQVGRSYRLSNPGSTVTMLGPDGQREPVRLAYETKREACGA